jgi:hypothetical protein
VTADAGTDGDAGEADAGFVVAAPEIPWLETGIPSLGITPCPAGWREVEEEEGVRTCEPYPEGGPSSCELGEAHFPGETGCRPIGEPCPPGDYATSLPTDGTVVYVNGSAAPGGDGSIDSPYASLTEVNFSSLTAGMTLAIAKGSYEGTLSLRAGVEVLGACAAETTLIGVDAPVPGIVTVASSGEPAVLRNLSIADSSRPGIAVENGRAATLEGVLIQRVSGRGVLVGEAGSLVTARDVVIADTQSDAGTIGFGIQVELGGRFEGTRVILAGNRALGVLINGDGSSVTLDDAVVRDTREQESDRIGGRGINVQNGASFVGSRLLVAGNRDMGIGALGAATTVMLEDVVVRDTDVRAGGGDYGRGLNVQEGARLEGTRVVVSHNHDANVAAAVGGAAIVLTDAVIREGVAESDGTGGRGISLREESSFEGVRVIVSQNRNTGTRARGVDSSLTLTDSVVRDTRSRQSDGAFGHGIELDDQAHFTADRVLVARNRFAGVVGYAGTMIELTDTVVRDTLGQEASLIYGTGLVAQDGARMSAERVWVDGANEFGVLVVDGAAFDARDIRIERVVHSACECPERIFGYAVVAAGAEVQLARFHVRQSATCGLFVASRDTIGALDAEMGVVEESQIGACVQIDGYEIDRLTREVTYRSNEVNLDATMLPVPDPLGL